MLPPGSRSWICRAPPVAAPGEERPPRFLFRNREIFLSEYAMAELEKIGEIPDRRPQICLTYLGATKKFTIAGVVGAFEAPRTTRYELFILDTTVKRMIGDTATAQNFSEMQVYFDPAHLSDARSWLEREGWRFIGDMMDRTENLIAAAWNGLLILGAIALANLVLFIAITYYIATSYLAKNAQSFAVLQSFGLSWRTAAWQSAIETTLTLVLAALPLAMVPVALAIAGPLELGEFGRWAGRKRPQFWAAWSGSSRSSPGPRRRWPRATGGVGMNTARS